MLMYQRGQNQKIWFCPRSALVDLGRSFRPPVVVVVTSVLQVNGGVDSSGFVAERGLEVPAPVSVLNGGGGGLFVVGGVVADAAI